MGEGAMKSAAILLALLSAIALPACTDAEKNASAREWQRNECNRVVDREDREKCLKRID
jgi:hypothetical protein